MPSPVGDRRRIQHIPLDSWRASPCRSAISALVPGSVVVETFSDAPDRALLPAEAAAVARAIPERQREFGTVRHCAREAMRSLGVPSASILPDADGAPVWPASVVGSMTHCAGYRAAIVAPSDRLCGIGIDAEPDVALQGPVRDLILRDEERRHVDELTAPHPERHWDSILFCAKEAVYKAWFPLTRRWLDFGDVEVTLDPGGSFVARVGVPQPHAAGLDLGTFDGRWTTGRGVVVVATWVPCVRGAWAQAHRASAKAGSAAYE
jgi:4'-phosphopantetheinyl transferase EntD